MKLLNQKKYFFPFSKILGNLFFSLLITLYSILLPSCETDLPPNPYDDITNPIDTINPNKIDPNSIAGLHKNIFKPTCANSGCHDGTFEPDYRTIESTYNTLVFQPIVKNDTLNTYQYRVVPGNVNASMLYVRLTTNLNGNSGVMPLELEPDSDWLLKKDDYIQNVVNWINGGAKDLFGNTPVIPNRQPQMLGAIAFPAGSSIPFSRTSNGAMRIPNGSGLIDIWFSLADDSTAVTDLLHNKVKFSLFMNDFEFAEERSLQIVSAPMFAKGYEGPNVSYYHKITVNPYDFGNPGNNIYLRIYVKDPQNDITEIPAKYSENIFKTYFTLILLQ